MRCTKCHYLSFEPEPRCRNCGNDLSIEEESFELADATLEGLGEPRRGAPVASGPASRVTASTVTRGANALATAELPLFMRSMPVGLGTSDILAGHDLAGQDDEPEEELVPLVKVPARPRVPVSVRRATPDAARLRAKYGMSPSSEPDLLSGITAEPADNVQMREEPRAYDDLPLAAGPTMTWPSEPTPQRLPAEWQQTVAAPTRLMASAIDAGILGAIVSAVMYFTLQVTGLTISQVGLLPALPLVTLFVMISLGYLLMFTVASGQTIGKMVMNIRVVGTSPEAVINDRVTVSQAMMRSLMALPSVLAFGIGFIPALMGGGLAVHDRIAHTRVVRL